MMDIANLLSRHEKIGLQFSGGRDSLATVYLLRPWLDRITVYWGNTDDPYPETLEVVDHVRAMCPNFIEINGRQPQVVAEFGIPSDLVPVNSTPLGLSGARRAGPLIQDRYSCCWRVVMYPLHQRMKDDGVTLIIRGQREADNLKGPLRSGDTMDGFEFLYPIEAWSDAQTSAYLVSEGAPLPRFYDTMSTTPGCMTCSAFWEDGQAQYLKRHHPETYGEVQRRLNIIKIAVEEHIAAFNIEVNS
jgi:3'-phosphoadenosine 5'-phosphosulfate sulfotransferase (PAPS reductase)/FAD synthetase